MIAILLLVVCGTRKSISMKGRLNITVHVVAAIVGSFIYFYLLLHKQLYSAKDKSCNNTLLSQLFLRLGMEV